MAAAAMSDPPRQPIAAPDANLTATAVGLCLLTSALWGGTPVAISYSVDTLPPIAVAAIRFALAALFMFIWCFVLGDHLLPRRGQWRDISIAGFLLFVQIALFHVGVEKSSSSHGSLFINTFVFWVVLIEHFVTATYRLAPRRVLGLACAAAGMFLVLNTSAAPTAAEDIARDTPSLLGDVILLISSVLLGIKIVFTKAALKRVEPGKLMLWHDIIGVGLLAVASAFTEEVSLTDFTRPALLALVYQGVFVGGLCFAIQAQLLKTYSATKIAVFSFTTPLFGVLWAVLFRGDDLSSVLLCAGAAIALGIFLVTKR